MKEILDLAVLEDSDDNSDVDDAVLLHILHENENLGNRGALYGRLDLENLSDGECKNLFRFFKNDISRLAVALNIPNRIVTNERISVSVLEGFCILLRRLAYPNRLVDLEPIFGLSSAALSSVINCLIDIISTNKGHLLQNLRNVPYLNQEKLRQYSQVPKSFHVERTTYVVYAFKSTSAGLNLAITGKHSPVNNSWGFIDGTARAICRPSINQENYYSGHKKIHCVKYQSVICPDGIIISLKGAYEGRRHDAGILRESGFYDELEENVRFSNEYFVLYGDQGYGLRELLLRPFGENEIIGHPERQQFNNQMSVLRIAVEWGFSKVLQEFAFVDFKKNQKILLQEIGTMYYVAVLLTHCHTCLYGSETSSYLDRSSRSRNLFGS